MKQLYQIKHFNAFIAIYKLAQKNLIDELKRKYQYIWRGSDCDKEDSALLTQQLSILAGKPLFDIKEQDALLEIVNEFYKIIEKEKDTSPIFENPRANPFLLCLSEIEAQKYALFLEPIQTLEHEKKANPILSLYHISNSDKKPFKNPVKTVLEVKKDIIILNFHFLIRQGIEKNIKKRYPIFSLPLFGSAQSISVWKKCLKKN